MHARAENLGYMRTRGGRGRKGQRAAACAVAEALESRTLLSGIPSMISGRSDQDVILSDTGDWATSSITITGVPDYAVITSVDYAWDVDVRMPMFTTGSISLDAPDGSEMDPSHDENIGGPDEFSFEYNLSINGTKTITPPAGTPINGEWKLTASCITWDGGKARIDAWTIVVHYDLPVTDLSVESVTSQSAVVHPGDAVDFSVQSHDAGAASGQFPIKFYLSPDKSLSSGDFLLGELQSPSMVGGESRIMSLHVDSLPASIASGNYYVLAKLDPNNEVFEYNEGNNVGASAGTIAVRRRADLTPKSPTISATTIRQTDPWSAEVTVSNTGEETSGAFKVAFYASSDSTLSSGDYRLGEVSASSLAAGQSEKVSLALSRFPSTGVPLGLNWLIVVVDSANSVVEHDESNNNDHSMTFQVAPAPLPDLQWDSTKPPQFASDAHPGEAWEFTCPIINSGTATTGNSFNVEVWAIAGTTIASSDYRLGLINLPKLASGESTTLDLKLDRFPISMKDGTYHLALAIDPAKYIAESDRDNNTAIFSDLPLAVKWVPRLAYTYTVCDADKNELGPEQPVAAGETFYLCIKAKENVAGVQGIGSLIADIDYDNALVQTTNFPAGIVYAEGWDSSLTRTTDSGSWVDNWGTFGMGMDPLGDGKNTTVAWIPFKVKDKIGAGLSAVFTGHNGSWGGLRPTLIVNSLTDGSTVPDDMVDFGSVSVKLVADRWDINDDGVANTADLAAVRGQLIRKRGEAAYVIPLKYDFNHDQVVNTADLSAMRGELLKRLGSPAAPMAALAAETEAVAPARLAFNYSVVKSDGSAITGPLSPGETFKLQIMVQENDAVVKGIGSVIEDIGFDSTRIAPVDYSLNVVNTKVWDKSLTDTSVGGGFIDNLGAFVGGMSIVGNATGTLLAEIPFRVLDNAPAGTAALTGQNAGALGAGVDLIVNSLNDGQTVVDGEVDFGSAAITVAGGASSTITINGDQNGADKNDIIRLACNADRSVLSVFVNSLTPTASYPLAGAQAIVVNGGEGNDRLEIDGANGLPSLLDGIAFNGGAGIDTLLVNGSGNERIVAAAGQTTFGGAQIHLAEAEKQVLDLKALDLQDSTAISLAQGGHIVLKLGSLNIGAGRVLDLNDNSLIITATPQTRQQVLQQVSNWIKGARGTDGKWLGAGMNSSSAKANKQTGLAVMLNDKGGKPILTTFDGQTVGTDDILVKYTWNGDVNLDGVVDAADYFLVDSGFITQAGQYRNGDLTLDGVTDAGDYFLIDSAFIAQTGTLAAKIASPVQQLFSVKPVL